MTLGAATCGAEFLEQYPSVEIVIVPVGGGGLLSGIATAMKLAKPDVIVVGVEPYGADAMYRSLEENRPVRIEEVSTFADSLLSPTAMPYSFMTAKA